MNPTTSDLIRTAAALLSDPAPVSIPEGADDATADALQANALRDRISAWLAACQDKHTALRHLRIAALARVKHAEGEAAVYEAEAAKFRARAAREGRTVEFAEASIFELLWAERELAMMGPGEPYSRSLPDGSTHGIRLNPPAVVVEDEARLPSDVWRVVPEKREPDKAEIARRLKAGAVVEGAKLVRGERLDLGRPARS